MVSGVYRDLTEFLEEKSPVTTENVSKEKIVQAVKEAHKSNKESSNEEIGTEEKIYNLGFMPLNEVAGLVVNELEETYDLDRVKKLWLPRSQKAAELINSDIQMLDEQKMQDAVKEIDVKYSKQIEKIENKLKQYPFWQANKYVIKMIKIDELICLQNYVNLDRANFQKSKITKNASMEELLDFCFPTNRKTAHIHSHMVSNNAVLFSTEDHDVRPGKIEVRKVPKFGDDGTEKIPALVIPVLEGDPFVYCVRTYAPFQMPDQTTKKVYFLTLQNGIHRAYALKSLGIGYMPCIIIDPTTAAETQLVSKNWTPERAMQNVSQRPPLMKDFFNYDLTEKFKVRKRLMCIRVEWKIEPFTT